jgi:hypothetical protein
MSCSAANMAADSDSLSSGVTMYRQARRTNPIEDFGRNGRTPVPRLSFIGNNRIFGDTGHGPPLRQTSRLRRCEVNACGTARAQFNSVL